MGRRVQKKVYTYQTDHWSLTTELLFVYDGWNLICEQTTPDGQPTTDKYYIWGLDLSQSLQDAGGIGGLIATVDDSTSAMYYYQYDANGNVTELIDASDGSMAAHYEYDPYGKQLVSTGPEADNNPFRFSTKYFDDETGLYYYGYRYYSPQLGRWLTRDPLGEIGGLNLYNFTLNNPINKIDPYGLDNFNNDQWPLDGRLFPSWFEEEFAQFSDSFAEVAADDLQCFVKCSVKVLFEGEAQKRGFNVAMDYLKKEANKRAWKLAKQYLKQGKKIAKRYFEYSLPVGIINCAVECTCN